MYHLGIMNKVAFAKVFFWTALFVVSPVTLFAASESSDVSSVKSVDAGDTSVVADTPEPALTLTDDDNLKDAAKYYAKAQKDYAAGDFTLALQNFQKAAERGDVKADFQLGVMYLYGRGVKEDSSTAASYFKKAADKGNAGASLVLGRMYIKGNGVPKDVTGAVKIYEHAAKDDPAFFGYVLGKMYLDGGYVPQDEDKAMQWLQKSGDEGSAAALYLLGTLYEGKDNLKSSEYFAKSAAIGYKPAVFKTGGVEHYKIIDETTKTGEKIWMLRAAGEGDREALYELAGVFHHIPSDVSLDWTRKSSAPDNNVKINALDDIEDTDDTSEKIVAGLVVPLIFIFSVAMVIISYASQKQNSQKKAAEVAAALPEAEEDLIKKPGRSKTSARKKGYPDKKSKGDAEKAVNATATAKSKRVKSDKKGEKSKRKTTTKAEKASEKVKTVVTDDDSVVKTKDEKPKRQRSGRRSAKVRDSVEK